MALFVLNNRYEVQSLIGEGGMASVYLAVDLRLGRQVAAKLLHAHIAQEQELVLRFQQEASLAARLEHANIVKIYDYGLHNDGRSFIISELIRGKNLHELQTARIRAGRGPFEPPVCAMICLEVLEGLSFAHANQVVHRDIKPDNVMISNGGEVKLTDFGIAKNVSRGMTVVGQYLGSPSYSSPEQVTGKPIDYRTDLFSAGIILYEALSAELPFKGSSANEVMKAIARGNCLPIEQTMPQLDSALVQILGKSLRVSLNTRYKSAKEMAADLQEYLKSIGIRSSRQGLVDYSNSPTRFLKALQSSSRPPGDVLTSRNNRSDDQRGNSAKTAVETKPISKPLHQAKFIRTLRRSSRRNKPATLPQTAQPIQAHQPTGPAHPRRTAAHQSATLKGIQNPRRHSRRLASRNQLRSSSSRPSQTVYIQAVPRNFVSNRPSAHPIKKESSWMTLGLGTSILLGLMIALLMKMMMQKKMEEIPSQPDGDVAWQRKISQVDPMQAQQDFSTPTPTRLPQEKLTRELGEKRELSQRDFRKPSPPPASVTVGDSYSTPSFVQEPQQRTKEQDKKPEPQRSQIASLQFSTIPAQVPISINGRTVEGGTVRGSLDVPPGRVRLRLGPAIVGGTRYLERSIVTYVEPGATKSLGILRLVPVRTLTLKVRGTGVIAKIDGDPYALRNGTLKVQKPEGLVDLEISASNGRKIERKIDLRGDDVLFEASLE